MKSIGVWVAVAVCLLLTGCAETEKSGPGAWPWILALTGCAALMMALWQTLEYRKSVARAKKQHRKPRPMSGVTVGFYGAAVVMLLAALLSVVITGGQTPEENTESSTTETTIPHDHWEDTGAGKKYVFADGTVATGWLELDNRLYYFSEDGTTLSGWQELEGVRRYFREDGSMARGEETIDGVRCFFTSTGAQVEVANPWNAVPKDQNVELMDLSPLYAISGIRIDVKIYAPLKEMMDACNAAMAAQYGEDASKCCVTSGYRTMEDQTRIYDTQVASLMYQGYSQEDAEKQAATAVALPGTSEHQLGLAVDIVDTGSWDLDEFQDDLPAQQWLIHNSWKYGFILRYPEGKTDVTGIIYEPWHYRYVGKELAKEIYDLNLTLEEYLAALD